MLFLRCEPFAKVLSLDPRVDLFESLLHAPLLDDCEVVLITAYSAPGKGPAEQVSSSTPPLHRRPYDMMRIRRTMTKTDGTTIATIMVLSLTDVFESSSLAIKMVQLQESICYIEGDDLEISRMTCTTIGSRLRCSEAHAEVMFRRGR
jgi:hypothetical protein